MPPEPIRTSNKYGVISKSRDQLIVVLGDKEPPEEDRLRLLGELSAATKLPVDDLQFVTFEEEVKVEVTDGVLPAEGIVSEETRDKLNKINDFNKDAHSR
jgi:hypothetical protein